jgi:hypothetical protein
MTLKAGNSGKVQLDDLLVELGRRQVFRYAQANAMPALSFNTLRVNLFIENNSSR